MGFYSRVIFPRGCDWVMSTPILTKYRKEVLAGVTGKVLEIGFGTGLNLAHYPAVIRELAAVDVNPGMNSMARKRIEKSSIAVNSHTLSGENLPMEDELFDSVVSAWTLCSIKNVDQAMREIFRVLKPGGRLFFIEHGLSGDPKVQRWQNRLTPVQKTLADGCHINRDIKAIIERPKMRIEKLNRFYMGNTLKILGYTYQGTAVK